MKLLITGGAGFLGSNLARRAIETGKEVLVFDNLSRPSSSKNLEWLSEAGKFEHINGDVRIQNDIERTIASFKPDAVFHLAGQVAMTTSIQNPRKDFEINVMGTFNVLDSVRRFAKDAPVIYSSTNKVYGDLEWTEYKELEKRWIAPVFPNGFDESAPLDFHSPYGVSKGSGDQYCLDFARIFGLRTVVFRHSSMYGGRQFATEDQGWVGWFCQKAVEQKNNPSATAFTISGDGKQVRDVLYSEDMMELYDAALANIDKAAGQAFNIGGGIENSLSLLELFDILAENSGVQLRYKKQEARESDQRVFVANIAKAKNLLGWSPKVSAKDGVGKMYAWVDKFYGDKL
jgi:CDP-paratose 2-epimerase